MVMKRSLIAVFAILACLTFAWATGAGRAYPASAGGVIDPTCSSSLPCIEYDNNGNGPGIRGISVSGNGLAGATKNASTSASNGRAGLIGNDTGTGTFNSGVHGLSVGGTGVLGASTNGVGVQGTSSKNNGVYGVSNATGASGVFGLNSGGFGVAGTTTSGIGVRGDGGTNGVGVLGLSIVTDAVRGVIGSGVASSFHAGVAGLDSSTSGTTNEGVYGQSTLGIGMQGVSPGSGTGVLGSSTTGVGVNAVGGFYNSMTHDHIPALSIVANAGFGDLIDACQGGTPNPCDGLSQVFQVSNDGSVGSNGLIAASRGINSAGDIISDANITIVGSGSFTKNGGCVAGCSAATSGSVGHALVTYAPMVSQPAVEDFGETQLINGQASVHLDPRFANAIDQRANYLVFITPEGDSNVLYVTQKSLIGFTVRESHGGRSTLIFSYRIVAKPFGSSEARLPMVEVPRLRPRLLRYARQLP